MAKQLGDFGKPGAVAQQPSCHRVAKAMRPERWKACSGSGAANDSSDCLTRKTGEWRARPDK
jgi:hypothetical protein